MWRIRLTDGGVVCAVLALLLTRSEASLGTPPSVTTADELVRRALQAEVDGQAELRTKQLDQAVQASPSHPAAHWHRGEVRVGDAWVAFSEAERQAAQNPILASYAQLRDASPDSGAAHFAMAAFCRKNDLPDRERWHWANVLRFQPGNKDAIRALGLRKYGNEWLTQREIDEREQLSREQRESGQKWQLIVERLRKSLENPDSEQHEPALAELRAIDDVAAIPFLEAGFSDADEWIQREAVGTLGKMRDPAATYALLRTSVLAPSESVRDAAADQLKPRPVFSYIPILMGSLETPVEYSYYFVVYATGTGQAFASHVTLFRQGPLADYALTYARNITRRGRGTAGRWGNVVGLAHQADLLSIRQATRANADIQLSNFRICRVLHRTTDQNLEDTPQAWWKWWTDYNELSSSDEKPLMERVTRQNVDVANRSMYSCFVPGTIVWAETGPTAIEHVRVGDRVLAQDPHSGELAYKLVIGTTAGPLTPIIRMVAGGTEFGATHGHVFWRVGDGWRMAKELHVGDQLHSLSGAVPIDSIGDATTSTTHNLIVQDFATYFVGQSPLLTHDITARQVTSAIVPGLLAE